MRPSALVSTREAQLCIIDDTYRTALLCSLVWQWRKRSSLRVLVKAYLLVMMGVHNGGRM